MELNNSGLDDQFIICRELSLYIISAMCQKPISIVKRLISKEVQSELTVSLNHNDMTIIYELLRKHLTTETKDVLDVIVPSYVERNEAINKKRLSKNADQNKKRKISITNLNRSSTL